MARTKGLTTFAGNFESEKSAPLVDMFCETVADMIDATEQQAYDGNTYMYYGRRAIVFNDGVNNGTYQLVDPLNPTLEESWEKILGTKDTVVKKIRLAQGEKKEFYHNLGTGNLHISVYLDGHPVEIAVNDVMENSITATTDVSGLYTFIITKVLGFDYKNYAFVEGTGVVVTDLISFTTEKILLSGKGTTQGIMIDDKLYVVLHTEQELHEIDPFTGVDIRTPISLGAEEYQLHTDGTNIYLFGPGSNVLKVDIDSWAISASLPSDFPIGGTIDFDKKFLYVVESSTGYLKEIDLTTFTYTGRSVSLPTSAWGLYGAVNIQNYIYITLYYDGSSKGQLHRVEKTGFTYVDSVDTPRGCGVPILVDKEVIFPCYNDNVWVAVDVIGNSISRNVSNNGVWYISNIRNKLYISGRSDTNIVEYNLDNNSYTGRVNDVVGNPESNETF